METQTRFPIIVTQMSVLPSTMRSRAWIFWVTALSLVLGGLLAGSLKTQRSLRSRFGLAPGTRGGIVAALAEQGEMNKTLRAEIEDLRQKNTEWEKQFASGVGSSRALGEELQRV